MRYILALLIFLGAPALATAQSVCATHQTVTDKLKQTFDERPVNEGLSSNGGMLEIFVSPNGETWTIVLSRADGVSCLMATGEHWESVRPKVIFSDKDSM
jgi:hypothetical protein